MRERLCLKRLTGLHISPTVPFCGYPQLSSLRNYALGGIEDELSLLNRQGYTHFCINPYGAFHFCPFPVFTRNGRCLADEWVVMQLPALGMLRSADGVHKCPFGGGYLRTHLFGWTTWPAQNFPMSDQECLDLLSALRIDNFPGIID